MPKRMLNYRPNGLEETIIKEIEQNQLTWYGAMFKEWQKEDCPK